MMPSCTVRFMNIFSAIVESPLLDVALQKHKGQVATAARSLGLHRTTLRKKLEEHGIGDSSSVAE